ncbi:MAG TPA: serine hydrolase domain-containing protein [Stackebrandtia sp.]|uniref:serine hydrolase domain-containing protein n=1 Tax=Stackebrandtia sp. TaxID=2023065 RepID=UPI002D32B608|nr:serine hydrolase domain-containing protein [Stackebrandtia sp.]HZE39173.1 serine hydrolase domain-containing protein [Stackebrandtia sp.]
MTTIHGTTTEEFAPVREAFEANFRHGDEIGAAVAVYRHGRPVADLWGGVADPDADRPWRRDTAQVIYSATKSAVAACAHLLVGDGLLDVDAPVSRYWPEFAANGKEGVPVRWLLSHRAGLPALDGRLTIAEVIAWHPVIDALAAQRPQWTPGSRHGYHGLTYGWLVGEVIRRVTGDTPGAYFARRVAEPLGLDFWIGTPASEHHRVARIVATPPEPVDPDALTNDARRAIAVFTDPTSLAVRSVTMTTEPLDLNDPRLLSAEIPAVNGVCTARSLATFYAALIGDVDGVRLLDDDALAAATAEQANGVDHVLRTPTRPALGFGLPLPDMPWWTPTAFGFPGHGGSLGYADPRSGMAFGYVMNRLHQSPTPDPRAARLVRAVRRCLGE